MKCSLQEQQGSGISRVNLILSRMLISGFSMFLGLWLNNDLKLYMASADIIVVVFTP